MLFIGMQTYRLWIYSTHMYIIWFHQWETFHFVSSCVIKFAQQTKYIWKYDLIPSTTLAGEEVNT